MNTTTHSNQSLSNIGTKERSLEDGFDTNTNAPSNKNTPNDGNAQPQPKVSTSLMRFIDKSLVPSGGFVYVEPASGVRFRTLSWNNLAASVRAHRIANGYPLFPGWEIQLETEVCKQYGPGTCIFIDDSEIKGTRTINVSDVKNFLLVVGTWMATGGKFVDASEATWRAKICADCPKNQEIAGCSGCSNLTNTITGLIGGRSTEFDYMLKGCAVCSCSNKAQVHIPIDVLHKGVTEDMEFPQHCWKKI